METTKRENGLTDAQLAAINSPAHSIVVSAGAGSGKTFVMIERILRLLGEGADIRRMLVSTFTNAAAADMKKKLSRALEKKIDALEKKIKESEDPAEISEAEKIKKNLLCGTKYLSTAEICTLHSWCTRIIKRWFFDKECFLDREFDILDDGEEAAALDSISSEIIEEYREREDKDFADLYTVLLSNRSSFVLKKAMIKVYRFAIAQPAPSNWRDDPKNWLNKVPAHDDEFYRDYFLVPCKEKLAEICEEAKLLSLAIEKRGFEPDRDDIKELLQAMACGVPHGKKLASLKKSKKYTADEYDEMKSLHEDFKNCRNTYNKLLAEYNAIVNEAETPSHEGSLRFSKTLGRLVCELKDRYDAYKRARMKADYSDLEHCTLALINGDRGGDIVKEYDFVFVDEYQDINPLQEEILKKFKCDMFFVGDIKQSIYGFRMCNPKFFAKKFENHQKRHDAGDKSCEAVELSINFRSGSEVLGFVNEVFAKIMKKDEDYGADYTPLAPNGKKTGTVRGITVDQDKGGKPPKGIYLVMEDLRGGEGEYACEQDGVETEIKADGEKYFAQRQAVIKEVARLLDTVVKDYDALEKYDEALKAYDDAVSKVGSVKEYDEAKRDFDRAVKEYCGTVNGYDEKLECEDAERAYAEVAKKYAAAAAKYAKAKESYDAALRSGRVAKEYAASVEKYHETVKNYAPFVRRMNFDDIVILLRSTNSDFCELLVNSMRENGIPVTVNAESNADDFTVVSSLISFMRVLDNSRDDINLAAVMVNEAFGGFTLDEVGLVRKSGDELYDCVFGETVNRAKELGEELDRKLKLFSEKICSLRDRAAALTVSSLAGEITAQFDCFNYALKVGGGREAAALDAYLEHLATLTENDGLHDYIKYIGRVGTPTIKVGGGSGAVRVMTIHSSKGLEFTHVILPHLDKDNNDQDTHDTVICSENEGVVMRSYDMDERTKKKSARFCYCAKMKKKELMHEEMRVLYVALTRAKLGLTLIAEEKSVGNSENDYEPSGDGKTDYYDWLGPFVEGKRADDIFRPSDEVLMYETDGGKEDRVEVTPRLDFFDDYKDGTSRVKAAVSSVAHSAVDGEHGGLSFTDGYESVTRVEKAAVSGVNNSDIDDEDGGNEKPEDLFGSVGGDDRAEERGSAFHKFMQYAKFDSSEGEYERLSKLFPEEGAVLSNRAGDKGKFERALKDISAYAANSKCYREKPFVLCVPASYIGEDGRAEASVLVQGIIDLLAVRCDGGERYAEIVDYKTGGSLGCEAYSRQLGWYAFAVKELLGLEVRKTYLYGIEESKMLEVVPILPKPQKSSDLGKN